MVSSLGTLCQLPNELIHRILSLTNNKDLVMFGRLNPSCAEAMLPILTERVRSVMGKDGWRVYASGNERIGGLRVPLSCLVLTLYRDACR